LAGYEVKVMQRRVALTALIAALAATTSASLAQSPTAVKAARDATRQAEALTYQLDSASGSHLGTVTLQRIGSTRSRITVKLANPAAAGTRITLYSGQQCHDPHVSGTANQVVLNPVSQQVSQTVVALPLENLQSGNYLVEVQNATARSQFSSACARLGSQ
jgi:hypothetical protein